MTDSSPTAALDFPRPSKQPALTARRDKDDCLGSREERRLFRVLWTRRRSSREAQRARTRLVVAHLPVVVSVVAELAGAGELPARVSRTDILQEGNVALVRAVDRYHPDTKARFTAFARVIIRRALERAVCRQEPWIPAGETLSSRTSSLPDADPQHERVGELLESLTLDEELVLRYRFGIGTDDDHTLAQVAHLLGWTTCRVVRLNAQALAKLRHNE